jgi:trehalose 6-phosphate synthase
MKQRVKEVARKAAGDQDLGARDKASQGSLETRLAEFSSFQEGSPQNNSDHVSLNPEGDHSEQRLLSFVDPLIQVLVVANRLPVCRTAGGGGDHWQPSPGGLVSTLVPALRGRRSTWVGWTGDDGPAEPFTEDGICCEPVELSAGEIEGFYEGFSNRTLWPLYHDAVRRPEFDPDWWSTYVAVNERYATHTAQIAEPGALVWIHDYQLQLVPDMLRRLRPDLHIGFFLHISFPPQELFMQLPWRRDLIEGILGADVVGFQVPLAAQNFAVLANGLTKAHGRGPELTYGDRTIRIGAYPASIDVGRIQQTAENLETQLRAKKIREQLGSPTRILLGVDRLDYTKGIEARLVAYRELLSEGRISVPDCVMVQIAVPTRDNIRAYFDERVQIERLIGELNGEFGKPGAPAVQYLRQSVDFEELVALYCAADVLLVTPYKDGMNLVAKEYVASRIHCLGSVVLSEFAGAAQSMPAAYLVNPHDREALKQSMLTALGASPAEERRRMRSLRLSVQNWTSSDWANAFLGSLGRAGALGTPRDRLPLASPTDYFHMTSGSASATSPQCSTLPRSA